ncbi:MAG: hypothetical protein P1P84_09010 [Deferrisomatales bacterium]|nr:hypothetical protein [Deferrisomatales bacterium]
MKKWYHLLFVAICAAVLLVLFSAPEVTTPRLPADATHADRKGYPACPGCHGSDAERAMPEDHLLSTGSVAPNHLKCYFCHKPQED